MVFYYMEPIIHIHETYFLVGLELDSNNFWWCFVFCFFFCFSCSSFFSSLRVEKKN